MDIVAADQRERAAEFFNNVNKEFGVRHRRGVEKPGPVDQVFRMVPTHFLEFRTMANQ